MYSFPEWSSPLSPLVCAMGVSFSGHSGFIHFTVPNALHSSTRLVSRLSRYAQVSQSQEPHKYVRKSEELKQSSSSSRRNVRGELFLLCLDVRRPLVARDCSRRQHWQTCAFRCTCLFRKSTHPPIPGSILNRRWPEMRLFAIGVSCFRPFRVHSFYCTQRASFIYASLVSRYVRVSK